MLYDPGLEQYLEDTRNLNQLIAAFMENVPSFDTPEGRKQLREGDGFFPSPDVESVVEREIPGPAGPIPARTITPDTVDAVYLDIHGGGWCIGSAKSNDATNAEIAERANVAMVSIDYRLAPEDPYPAGPDDCEAAAMWLVENAEAEWGTDRLIIGGGSAGGHLSALTLLRVRDRHGADALARFIGANLIFGAYDLGMTPSQRASADALVIPLSTLNACLAQFLPGLDHEARRSPKYSPLYADLTGMPPALFTVGTLDPLLDDSLFMAARWQAFGNEAELAVYPECVHGFPAFPTELGRMARERIGTWVSRIVAGDHAAVS